MRLRFLIVAFLALTAVVYHAGVSHQVFLADNIAAATPQSFETRDGRMLFGEIEPDRPFGMVNPFATAGIRAGDELVSVTEANGQERAIRGMWDWAEVRRTLPYDQRWFITIARSTAAGPAERKVIEIPPVQRPDLPLAMKLFRICMFLILPLSAVPAALFLVFARPDDRNALVAAAMLLCFSSIPFFDPGSVHAVARVAAFVFPPLGRGLACPLLLYFFLIYPTSSPLDRSWPWLKWVALGWGALESAFAAAVSISQFARLALFERFMASPIAEWFAELSQKASAPIAVGMVTLAMVSLSMNRKRAATQDETRRLNLMLTACLVSWLPLGVTVVLELSHRKLSLAWIAILAMTTPVFPLTFVYVVLRHRVFGVRVFLRTGLQYALVSRGIYVLALLLFGGTYALAAPLISSIVPVAEGIATPLTSAAVAFALAAGVRVGMRRVMPAIDRRFFRDAYDVRQILSQLGGAIRRLAGKPEELIGQVGGQLEAAFHPRSVTIFLRPAALQGRRVTYGARTVADPAQPCGASGGFCCYVRREVDRPSPAALHPTPPALLCGDDPQLVRLEQLLTTAIEPLDLIPAHEEVPSPLRRINPAEQWADIDPALRTLTDDFGARLLVPLSTGARLIGFLTLGEKQSEEPYSREDRDLLQAVASQLAIALDYTELIGEAAERERLRQELSIAQDVQAQLFPQRMPQLPTLQLTGTCRPAREVGGDYYDFVELPNDSLGVALGDISGKGVSAALLMANLQGGLRSQALNHGAEVALMLTRINRLMCRTAPSSKFATLFYGHWDGGTRTLTWANAGHNPVLLLRHGAAHVERLGATGLVVGVVEDAHYEQVVSRLEPGDLLVLYTDGITEAENERGEFFGEQRLSALVEAYGDAGVDELRELILAEVERFSSDAPQHDDITLVLARVV